VPPRPRRDLALLAFTALLLLQGGHMVEHAAQVVQAYALRQEHAHGLVGALDLEVVHLLFNGLLFLGLMALAPFLGWRRREGVLQRPWRGAYAFLLLVQGYHAGEHVVKFQQHLATGAQGTPGLLGAVLPGIPLHFALNGAVLALLAWAWWQWRAERGWSLARERARLRPVDRRGARVA
jgi:hypothetical protein